ncbi:MAG: ECF-type sigma factor, partial [Acidobacteriota bacterium]
VTLLTRVATIKDVEVDLLDLHNALERYARIAPRPAQLVELRYFGGLTNPEAAEVLGVSLGTVERDWRLARMWLGRELAR